MHHLGNTRIVRAVAVVTASVAVLAGTQATAHSSDSLYPGANPRAQAAKPDICYGKNHDMYDSGATLPPRSYQWRDYRTKLKNCNESTPVVARIDIALNPDTECRRVAAGETITFDYRVTWMNGVQPEPVPRRAVQC